MNPIELVLSFSCLLALAVIGPPPLTAAQSASLIHQTANEVTYEVTSNGLSRIAVQGRVLAVGEWSVFNAESWCSRGATNGPVRAKQFRERTLVLFDYGSWANDKRDSETTLHANQTNAPPRYRLWSGVSEWEVYRWLCPGAEIATRLHDVRGTPPAGMESVDRWCARNRVIPLVPVNDFRRAPEIKSLQAQPRAASPDTR